MEEAVKYGEKILNEERDRLKIKMEGFKNLDSYKEGDEIDETSDKPQSCPSKKINTNRLIKLPSHSSKIIPGRHSLKNSALPTKNGGVEQTRPYCRLI